MSLKHWSWLTHILQVVCLLLAIAEAQLGHLGMVFIWCVLFMRYVLISEKYDKLRREEMDLELRKSVLDGILTGLKTNLNNIMGDNDNETPS